MKTPLQEVFAHLRASKETDSFGEVYCVDWLLENEKSLLEKEKEMKTLYEKIKNIHDNTPQSITDMVCKKMDELDEEHTHDMILNDMVESIKYEYPQGDSLGENNLDSTYKQLLEDILTNGVEKEDRTGTGTISVFGRQFRHKMSDGFPLLTSKRMAVKTMVTELKWFLKGDTNIKYLVENGCNIWNGDAYKRYQYLGMFATDIDMLSMEDFIKEIKTDSAFAKYHGDLGPIYGKQWRDWEGRDQIRILIETLKNNPDSRRLMVNAWNVDELNLMTLPPCHYGFQLYTQEIPLNQRLMWWNSGVEPGDFRSVISTEEECDENDVPKYKLSLMWNQRSVDTFLGLPFNIASYGLLLCLIAEEVGMIPDELIGNLGDVHLYKNHVDQAKEQIERVKDHKFHILPKLHLENVNLLEGDFDAEFLGYIFEPTIKAPLSN